LNTKNFKMKRLSLNRSITLITLLLVYANYYSQNNILLERSFWKDKPDINTIDSCIRAGNDPTELNQFAFDATSWAIIEDNPFETIKYLTSIDGNGVNKMTHDARTYIFWAMYRDNLPLMNYLYDKGAKIDIIDSHGYSLINFGAVTGQTNTALYDFCIERGAVLKDQKNNDGANPLLLVSPFMKDKTLINYFTSKGINIHEKDDNGDGIFNYTSKRGNKKMLLNLIDLGVDYVKNEKSNSNAILFATYGTRGYQNPLETYIFLDSIGIDPLVVTKKGETPLHNLAYKSKDKEIINFFIEKNANFNQINNEGDNPFMKACTRNNLEIINLFLKETDNINLKNNKGKSALSNAVSRNSYEIVDFLLKNGCDPSVVDNLGNNLIFLLVKSFKSGSYLEFEKKLAILLAKNVNHSNSNLNGETALHLAIEKNNIMLLEKLLNLGLDINSKDNNGITPLHLAVMKAENMSVIEFLIKNGADKNLKTLFGETAFDLALENEILNNLNINIKILK